MQIAGFQKQSLIDYPGNISSVIFTQGCNFRCPYCHNPELVLPEKFGEVYHEEKVLEYIKRYRNLLSAVCITGGEPTLHNDLPEFIARLKHDKLKVKLDTNGTNPDMLCNLLRSGLIDCVAMDIKHLLEYDYYNEATGNCLSQKQFDKLVRSVVLIKNSGIDFEFRTTVAKGIHKIEHLQSLKSQFGKNYVLHNMNPDIVLSPTLQLSPFSESEFEQLCCF